MSLAPAFLPMALGEPEAFARPLPLIDADQGTKFLGRDEEIRRLVDHCIEVSRLAKEDPDPANLALLEKSYRVLERLAHEHSEELHPEAQTADAKQAEGPSDIYFQGWLLCRDAEKSKAKGDPADAREKLKKALELFEQVAKEHPDWKPQMVQARLAKTKEELSSLPSSGE